MSYQVIESTTLPRVVHNDNNIVTHGYAVELEPGDYYYFRAKPPAYAFARAARMSNRVNSICLREAAFESQFDETTGSDRTTLILGEWLTERDDSLLADFVQGTRSDSSHWQGH